MQLGNLTTRSTLLFGETLVPAGPFILMCRVYYFRNITIYTDRRMAGQRSRSAKPKRYNVFVTLGGPQFDGVPLPTKGGNPLPLERATQTGHGTWQYLARSDVENVTTQYLERLLGVNGRGPLLVRINKDLGGSPPILVAAETGKEPLVNFLLVHFREDLTLPRTEDTNLLNTCIERCSMELAISVWPYRPSILSVAYGARRWPECIPSFFASFRAAHRTRHPPPLRACVPTRRSRAS